MADLADLISRIERLSIADDEVLVVRPRLSVDRNSLEILHRNLSQLADAMGWGPNRIVVLDRDVDLTVVKAEQMELT